GGAMRILRTIPISTAAGVETLNITGDDWRRIENAYGCKLSPEVRDCIHRETEEYIRSAELEANARPLSDVKERLRQIESAAHKALSVMLDEKAKASDAEIYLKRLVSKNFTDPRMPDSVNKFDSFVQLLQNFKLACCLAERELECLDHVCGNKRKPTTPTSDPFRPGTAWARWVRALTALAKERGLPWGVRKDSARRRDIAISSSSFVRFVESL